VGRDYLILMEIRLERRCPREYLILSRGLKGRAAVEVGKVVLAKRKRAGVVEEEEEEEVGMQVAVVVKEEQEVQGEEEAEEAEERKAKARSNLFILYTFLSFKLPSTFFLVLLFYELVNLPRHLYCL